MGGSGQPLETFGKGFKGKPRNLEMPGPIPGSSGGCRGTNNTEKTKPWELSQSRVGWWDEPPPRGLGGSRHLERGWGEGSCPDPWGGDGEEGLTTLGSPPGPPPGPAAAPTVFGVFLGLNFHSNVHFLFQFHINVSI